MLLVKKLQFMAIEYYGTSDLTYINSAKNCSALPAARNGYRLCIVQFFTFTELLGKITKILAAILNF